MEQKDNIIREKTHKFAIRIIKLVQFLKKGKEFILSDQIMRSGTSIWANIEEAIGWHTRKEFIQKVAIAYKEARETSYWIMLLFEGWYISHEQYTSMKTDIDEILKILSSILITAKQNTIHS